MKWRIGKSKLNFVLKILKKDRDNLCRRTIISEAINNIKGLSFECSNLCKELGLGNILTTSLTKSEIKNAINRLILLETRSSMSESVKVADRITDNPIDNHYLNYLPLHSSRLWFRYRARAIKGVKYNCKGSYSDLSCRFCNNKQEIETQEHLEGCEGNSFERRGLDKLAERDAQDTLKFWERMTIKLEKKKAEEKALKKEEDKRKKNSEEEERNLAAAIIDSLT